MVACSTFFGNGFFSSDIEQGDSEIRRIFPLGYKQAEMLREHMSRVCTAQLPRSIVAGKFLLRQDGCTTYVCSLFDKADYERRQAFKKKYPTLFSLIRFLFLEPEFATATLVWEGSGKLAPMLTFQSTIFPMCGEKIQTELFDMLKKVR